MNRIITGDCRETMREFIAQGVKVQTAVTSPPYWGLRNYKVPPLVWGGVAHCAHEWGAEGRWRRTGGTNASGLGHEHYANYIEADHIIEKVRRSSLTASTGAHCAKCGAWRGDLGLEPTPWMYVAHIVEVFDLVRELLADDGTLWLNLGDCYASGGGVLTPHRGLPKNRRVTQDTVSGAVRWRTGAGGNKGNGASGEVICRPNHVAGIERADVDEQSARYRPYFDGIKQKDMMGIPWAVAQALRASRYLGRIKNEVDRAWLAALVDGEGCITILDAKSDRYPDSASYPPILQVRMCDVECIARAAKITGYGLEAPEQQHPPSQGGVRGSYQWRLHGRKAADTMAEIYPHLLIKRKQAIVAWNHQVVRDSYETKRGVKIPAGALEKQIQCRELIRMLNKRRPMDIPDWMVEPPLPVRPGWYLRSDVIWHKRNPMPGSYKDRPTTTHEYLLLLAKRDRYLYDWEAISEPCSANTHARLSQDVMAQLGSDRANDGVRRNGRRMKAMHGGTRAPGVTPKSAALDRSSGVRSNATFHENHSGMVERRNKRSVWEIGSEPYKGAHTATFPQALVEPCVLAGSRPGDVVFDPFSGAGTVMVVAKRLGRRFLGCELLPEYVSLAEDRVRGVSESLFADSQSACGTAGIGTADCPGDGLLRQKRTRDTVEGDVPE